MKCVFARNKTRTDKNLIEPIYITNCGYYHSLDYDIEIKRPKGRNDFQILIPIKGSILINNNTLSPGEIYIYYPNEKQEYTYKSNKISEYYWMHFEGIDVINHLTSLNIHSGKTIIYDNYNKIASLIQIVLHEIYNGYIKMDSFSGNICKAILTIISSPPQSNNPFSKAATILSNPENHTSINDIANMYEISTAHFIRSFKKATGMSPLTFRTNKLMTLAKELLLETSLSIEKIALSTGYTDQFYFSRVFKNYYGLSPNEFRKLNLI